MLSNYLTQFNKQNPLNPSIATKEVKDVYGNMKAPEINYGPPTGANAEAAAYWSKYFGYPVQYANNKVSVESKGKADAWVSGTQAAGLEQVRPVAATEVGFNFGELNKDGNLIDPAQAAAYKQAMSDPNFASLVGSMVARKSFNQAGGDPFRAEAGYNSGFGTLRRADREGRPWPNPSYVQNMFPGQWDGNK